MIKKLKNFICKLFKIKACQCDDEQVVVKEEIKEEPTPVKVNHCSNHTRFKVSCPSCVEAVRV